MTRQRALPRRLTRATGRGDACGEPCLEFDDASRDPGAFELDVGQSCFVPCQLLSQDAVVRIGHHVSGPRASPLSSRRGYVTEGSSPKNPFRRAPNGKY
jgi:hypothetical protein